MLIAKIYPEKECMNRQTVTELSVSLLLKYYDNDTSLFMDCLDEEVLWYGPAEGQFLQGKKALMDAWAAESNPLTFTVNDLRTTAVSAGSGMCVVVLHYSVITHYPSGNNLTIFQRLALTWCERAVQDENGKRSRVPRILLCNVTNPHPKSDEDNIYPVHFEQVYAGISVIRDKGDRLHFTGLNNTEYYLFSGSILWGDSCAKGRRSELHLSDGSVVEVTMSVRDIAGAYPSLFLRCHSSHFVNPLFVNGIRRFAVRMPGGVELPIPEKGYTAFRKEFEHFVAQKASGGQHA